MSGVRVLVGTKKGAFVPLRVVVPSDDPVYLEGLLRDVSYQARHSFQEFPAYVLLRGRELWAVQFRLPVHEILHTLGDPPPGTTIAYVARGKPVHLILTGGVTDQG